MFGIPDKSFKRELWYFLSSIVIVHIAAYLVVPILPILLKNEKSMGAIEIGLILGISSFSMQAGSFISGVLSDRIGNKYSILMSNGLQSVGLIGMGLVHTLPGLILFSSLNTLGTGIYIPSTKAAISHIASEKGLTTAFSLRSIASHMGISISGLLIYVFSSYYNFYYGGFLYMLLFFLSWFYLPDNCGRGNCPPIPLKAYGKILKQRDFIRFLIISILIWCLHSQLAFLLPLRGDAVLKASSRIGMIWTITSISVILLQGTIANGFLARYSPKLSMALGVLLVGLGVSFLGFANSFSFMVLCGIIFITGEMLTMPTLDSLTGLYADETMAGAYYAASSIATGIGGSLGTFASGKIIDSYGITGGWIPWILYGCFTIFLVTTIILLVKKI